MTINELIKQLQDLLKNPKNNNLEVLFEDTIATTSINRVYVALADEEDDLKNPNSLVVVLSKK